MSTGVANGTSDATTAIVLPGARRTGIQMNIGDMKSSMHGVISACASFRSVAAAPMAMNSEP